MQTLLRLLLLSLFVAAGIGLAVVMTFHGDSFPVDWMPAWAEGPSVEFAEGASQQPTAEATGTPLQQVLPARRAEPKQAVTEPAISDFLEWFRQSASERQAALDAVRQALDKLPSSSDNPPAPSDSRATQASSSDSLPSASSLPPPSESPAPRAPAVSGATSPTIRSEAGDRYSMNIRGAEITDVLDMLSQKSGLNIVASPTTQGTVSASLNNVDLFTALDILVRNTGFELWRDGDVIYVGTAEEMQKLRRGQERMGIRVYRPNYVTAAELQKLVTPLLTQGVGQATVTVGTAVTSTPPKAGIAASADTSGGDDFAGNEVLLIRDYESVLHYVDQVVLELDQRPLQVSLEAMILSVRLNDENEFGVNLELLRDEQNTRLTSGMPLTDLAAVNLTEGGLKVAFLDSSVSAFVRALEKVGDTNVIAAPRLMCLNKQRAEILIGSQLGYVSTTITETAATQSVQFLEVGTQLRFRPYISSDGTIRLEVHPELSTGSVRIEQGFTLPDKEVTQVTTNIMCRDGRTIVIGGLIREDLGNATTQIPLLGSLPYVGALFRQKKETTERREIIVIITPRIVRESLEAFEGARTQAEFLARQENFADKMSFIGKRHYGQRYLRNARAAWNAGDAWTALRYVNLSLHFDPQNLEATALHAEIVKSMPPGANSIDTNLRQGLQPWNMPRVDYSKGGADWKTVPIGPPPPPGAELLDPGQPGPRRDLIPPPGP